MSKHKSRHRDMLLPPKLECGCDSRLMSWNGRGECIKSSTPFVRICPHGHAYAIRFIRTPEHDIQSSSPELKPRRKPGYEDGYVELEED